MDTVTDQYRWPVTVTVTSDWPVTSDSDQWLTSADDESVLVTVDNFPVDVRLDPWHTAAGVCGGWLRRVDWRLIASCATGFQHRWIHLVVRQRHQLRTLTKHYSPQPTNQLTNWPTDWPLDHITAHHRCGQLKHCSTTTAITSKKNPKPIAKW